MVYELQSTFKDALKEMTNWMNESKEQKNGETLHKLANKEQIMALAWLLLLL